MDELNVSKGSDPQQPFSAFGVQPRLSLSLSQLEAIVQAIPESVLVQDKNFRCIYANDLAARECGFPDAKSFMQASVEEVLSKNQIFTELGEVFPKEQLTARRALNGEDFAEVVYLVKNNGQDKLVKSISRPIYGKTGKIVFAVTIFRDITKEKVNARNAQFLADSSRIFSSSLDFNETIHSLGKLVVPRLADWYGVELLKEDGELEVVHAAHYDESKIPMALEMRKKYPSDPAAEMGVYQVLKSGESFLFNNFPKELYWGSAQNAEHLEMLKNLDLKSTLIVPLKVNDKAIGVMSLCHSDSNREFTEEDKALAEDLAVRAGVAIEHSKLYSTMQDEQIKLNLAINAAKLGVFDWDIVSEKLYWSDRTKEIFGYKKEEFKGNYNDYISRIHPDDRENSQQIVSDALENQNDYSMECRVLLPDSSVRWILCSGHASYDKEGNPVRIAGTVKDITWRKEAELNQAKVTQLQQMATLLSNKTDPQEIAKTIISQGIKPIGASGSFFLLVSKETGELKKIYSQGSFKKTKVLSKTQRKVAEDCIKTKKVFIRRKNRKDQNSFSTIVASPIVVNDQCIGVLGLQFNQTEKIAKSVFEYIQVLSDHAAQSIDRVRAFKETEEAKKKADLANRAKSTFLANMSHEIRTPMNAILGFSKLLSDTSISDEERKEYLRRVETNGDYLMHLIDDILDLSRVEAGEMRIEKTAFSFKNLINDVYGALKILVDGKDIKINIECCEEIPETIISDYVRTKQVIINLLSNAAKFTEKGSISLKVSLNPEKNNIIFDIIDTGIGIPQKTQGVIFKAFSQGDASVTRKYGGTGLGLILSRRICEALSGELNLVFSEQNQGAHFQIVLPLITGSDISEKNVEKTTDNNVSIKPMRILLAEDSPDNQMLMKIYLSDVAEHLDIVTNGKDALMAALNKKYDIILMDIQMPEMDGLQATKRLRERGYTKPIIALTAHALPEEVNRSLQVGCDSHLIKPTTKAALIEEITRFTS